MTTRNRVIEELQRINSKLTIVVVILVIPVALGLFALAVNTVRFAGP